MKKGIEVDWTKVIVEAVAFLAVATLGALVGALAMRRHPAASNGRGRSQEIVLSVITAFVVTEIWAQFSHMVRFSIVTLLICFSVAFATTLMQIRRA
ncbi:hypothetical protein [Austwickia chelonae]|uniref:hypothetical protein n=1 Tax=Austwickia chelonae TaxID=100225 RepID=UPI000E2559C8|nr:hypothetical protein [Austwickia chelonae]